MKQTHKKKNNKGFTMIEILGAITILGILSVVAITGVRLILDKSQDEFYKNQENNMQMAAENFYQQNRNELPKSIGQKSQIKLRELVSAKYLKETIKDHNETDCDIDESYVEVVKYSQSDYKYNVYLECPTYNSNKANSDIKPEILFDNETELQSKHKDIKNITAKITIKGGKDAENKEKKLASYNYIIYKKNDNGKYTKVKDSGSVKINNTSRTISVPLDKYLPGEIKVQMTAINEVAGQHSDSRTFKFIDENGPICGSNTGSKVWTADNKTIKVICLDKPNGSECARPYYTKQFTTEGKMGQITIKDIKGNETKCDVDVYIDRTKPTLKLTVRAGNASGKIIQEIIVNDKNPVQTINTGWINAQKAKDSIYIGYEVSDGVELKDLIFNNTTATEPHKIDLTGKSKASGELITITKDGYHETKTTLTDLSGKTVTVNLILPYDKTKPTLTYTNTSNGKWTEGPIEISASASDLTSGIAKTDYSYSNKPNEWNTDWAGGVTTSPVSGTWKAQRNAMLIIRTTDKAGNETVVETPVKIDTKSPAKPKIKNSSDEKCTTKKITVTATAEENYSGIDYWEYNFGGGEWYKLSSEDEFEVVIEQNKDTTMYIRAVDKMGHTSEQASTTIKKKSNCNSWPVNSCQIRGNKLRTVSGWTCTRGHYHTTAYSHYCSKSDGTLCVSSYPSSYPKCSKNTYNYVCPTSPYGKAQGWYIASGH